MEEEKAAEYYNELVRKGEGAARFKQGLGFSSASASRNDDAVPIRGSALPSSSSFFTSFVKADPSKAADFQKQANLQTIQNKLKKKPPTASSEIRQSSRVPHGERDDRDRHSRRRSRSRSRSRSRDGRGSRHRRRSNSSDRDRYRDKERDRERRRGRRSRSRSDSDEDRRRRRARGRSRSASPRDDRRRERSGSDRRKAAKEKNVAVDYARLIEGYETMTPAERVKAKMKLQLSETAEKDAANGMGPGWERFDFDKDAPLDDEEVEVAEDDVALVKHIGQSFRFSAIEAKREDQIKAAHDEAMFGGPSSMPPSSAFVNEEDEEENASKETIAPPSLISNMVISRQQGSWRDRARKA